MASLPSRPRQPSSTSSSSPSDESMHPISPTSGNSSHESKSQDLKHRHTRTSTAKVRTGCVTCKRRHVKCDETKPFCMNCLKTRGHCEGYAVKPRKPRAKPTTGSTRQTNANAAETQLVRAGSSPVRLLEPDLATIDFSDGLSLDYFNEFVRYLQVALGGRGALYSKFWKTTMPQMARTNETLRHAAIAIGALSRAFENDFDARTNEKKKALVLRQGSPHYHNAVVHYCRALRLQGQAPDGFILQDTIFLAILFIAFEVMRGDAQSAMQHINHGMALFFSMLIGDGTGSFPVSSLAPAPRALMGEVVVQFTDLAVQCRTVLSGRVGAGLPLPQLTMGLMERGQSLETFNVIMMQLPQAAATLDNMPAEFRSVEIAEEYWTLIQQDGAKLGPLIMDLLHESGMLETEDDTEIDDMMLHFLEHKKVREVCEESARLIELWHAAFKPLYTRALLDQFGTDPEVYMQVLQLQLVYLIERGFNWIPQYGDHGAVSALTPVCREIVSLAEIILRTSQQGFSSGADRVGVDGGTTWQLSVVSLHCRDPLVRDEAVRVLREYPRRDGLWSTRMFVAVGERNRALELANSLEGTVDEQWKRLWRREHIFEDAGKRIVFRFLEKNEETGLWDSVEEAAELEDGTDEVVWRRQPRSGKGKFILSNLVPASGYRKQTDV